MDTSFKLTVFIFISSLIDCILTILWLELGIAVEANPLMYYIIHHYGLVVFSLFKNIVVCFLSYYLFLKRNLIYAKLGLFMCSSVYMFILIVHFLGFLFFISDRFK